MKLTLSPPTPSFENIAKIAAARMGLFYFFGFWKKARFRPNVPEKINKSR